MNGAHTGGAPIDHYRLEWRAIRTQPDAGWGSDPTAEWETPPWPGLSGEIGPLQPDVRYAVRVRAVNDQGPAPATYYTQAQTESGNLGPVDTRAGAQLSLIHI